VLYEEIVEIKLDLQYGLKVLAIAHEGCGKKKILSA
jgi:hypothetical protein